MNKDGGQRPLGLGEFLFAELRQAFQDIRQKAVEEGWFGRVVTAAPVVEVDRSLSGERGGLHGDDHQPLNSDHSATSERRPSFEELWGPREPQDRSPERGLDIDR